MQIVVSRKHPVIDAETLTEFIACETLLRMGDGFILYMGADGDEREDRILFRDCRDALLWLNGSLDDPDRSYWHSAEREQ